MGGMCTSLILTAQLISQFCEMSGSHVTAFDVHVPGLITTSCWSWTLGHSTPPSLAHRSQSLLAMVSSS